MCNMVHSWLTISGLEEAEISNSAEKYISDLITQQFNPKQADTVLFSAQVNHQNFNANWLLGGSRLAV